MGRLRDNQAFSLSDDNAMMKQIQVTRCLDGRELVDANLILFVIEEILHYAILDID